jgi:hypothetical protein
MLQSPALLRLRNQLLEQSASIASSSTVCVCLSRPRSRRRGTQESCAFALLQSRLRWEKHIGSARRSDCSSPEPPLNPTKSNRFLTDRETPTVGVPRPAAPLAQISRLSTQNIGYLVLGFQYSLHRNPSSATLSFRFSCGLMAKSISYPL